MGRNLLLLAVLVLSGCTGPTSFATGVIHLSNEEVDFGDVLLDTTAEMSIVVTNLGLTELTFQAEIVEGSDAFRLLSAAVPTNISPRHDAQCRVAVSTLEPGEHLATLRVLSDDSNRPEILVPLSAFALSPEVHASSTSCDLGEVVYPCTSRIELSVTNQGTAPLQVFGIEVTGDGDEISASHDWASGTEVGHGQEAVFSVLYEPLDLDPDTATITVLTNDPVTPEVAFTCAGEARLTDAVTETFVQYPSAMDFLWVVDNSPDSLALQEKLAAEFPPFHDAVLARDIDFHLAVVTTETDSFQGEDRVIDAATADVATAFANAVLGSTPGSYTEQPLRYGSQAITWPLAAPGGENDGFVREDARLRIIFVSDADDESNDTVTAYVNLFQSLKVDPDWVVAHGITGQLAGCVGDGFEAASAQRLEQAISLTDGNSCSVCELDWGPMLTDLAEEASTLVDTFRLDDEIHLDTLPVVTVDGVETTVGWTYESVSNAVVFDVDHVPPPGAIITVTYIPLFEC